MPLVIFVTHDGNQYDAEADAGTSLMKVAVENGIDGILGECGGACSCGTCHCYVDENWLAKIPPPEAPEQSMLEGVLEPEPNSRLSCQILLTDELDGIVLRLPKSQY